MDLVGSNIAPKQYPTVPNRGLGRLPPPSSCFTEAGSHVRLMGPCLPSQRTRPKAPSMGRISLPSYRYMIRPRTRTMFVQPSPITEPLITSMPYNILRCEGVGDWFFWGYTWTFCEAKSDGLVFFGRKDRVSVRYSMAYTFITSTPHTAMTRHCPIPLPKKPCLHIR